MNLLILINSFQLGGAEKLNYDLAKNISQRGQINVFLYSIGKIENNLEKEIFQSFNDSSIHVGSFDKKYKRERLKTIIKIKRFCKENKIDVVHTNGQSPDFLMRCSKILGNKAKVVVTIHNTDGYSKTHEAFLSRFTDAYTAVSKEALYYSMTTLKIKKPIELIDNGIDIKIYSQIDNNSNDFEILSVGRVNPQKDYISATHFLAPFLKKHEQVKWLIFGDYSCNDPYYIQVKNECLKLQIQNSVVFMGVCTNPNEIYNHGKAFVLASKYEGFGIAFIEAIMSNHFVFSRNVGVVQDILKEGGTIHSIDDDHSMMFLEQLYFSNVQTNELSVNKKIVEHLYSLNEMSEKYISVYQRVNKNE